MKRRVGPFMPIFLILFAHNVYSQTTGGEQISPDRPGVGTPPSLVPPGHFQFESGTGYESSNLNGITTKQYAWNQSLFRFGVLSFAEIRLATSYFKTKVTESGETTSENGFGPLFLGAKIALLRGKGVVPKTSLMANFGLPKTGIKEYRLDNVAPSVFLLFQNSLSDRLSLGYSMGLIGDGESHHPTTFYSISLGLNLTDRLSCYAENYGYFTQDGHGIYVDAGFAFLVTRKIQLDVAGGINTKGGKADTKIALGFAWLVF